MESWRERHSVNCYFCGREFDEREGMHADEWNDDDGGSICSQCLAKQEEAEEEEAWQRLELT